MLFFPEIVQVGNDARQYAIRISKIGPWSLDPSPEKFQIVDAGEGVRCHHQGHNVKILEQKCEGTQGIILGGRFIELASGFDYTVHGAVLTIQAALDTVRKHAQ